MVGVNDGQNEAEGCDMVGFEIWSSSDSGGKNQSELSRSCSGEIVLASRELEWIQFWGYGWSVRRGCGGEFWTGQD